MALELQSKCLRNHIDTPLSRAILSRPYLTSFQLAADCTGVFAQARSGQRSPYKPVHACSAQGSSSEPGQYSRYMMAKERPGKKCNRDNNQLTQFDAKIESQ